MARINPALNAPLAALVEVIPTAQVERIERDGSVVVRTASKRMRLGLVNGSPLVCGYALTDEMSIISGTYSSMSGWYFSTARVSRQTRRNLSSVLPR